MYLLFLAAGLLEDDAREKSLVNVYIFQQPIALSLDDFKITQTDERKVLKIISQLVWFKKSLLVFRY